MSSISIDRVTALKETDGQIEISVSSRDGKKAVLRLSAAAAGDLTRILADAAGQVGATGAVATKVPKSFAVGSARYERLTLVRFEDDAPYALAPDLAREVAEALLAEADEVEQVLEVYRH